MMMSGNMVEISATFSNGKTKNFTGRTELGCIIEAIDFADNENTELERYDVYEEIAV